MRTLVAQLHPTPPLQQRSKTLNPEVVIVGGGPAGLMLAIELGCRDIRCLLLEEDRVLPGFPKANATSARTMEHYRRRGFAHRVRALGLPPDHPQDVVYCTRLAEHEIARFRIPSRDQALDKSFYGDYGEASWPTPELPHRAQQMYIEPALKVQAESYASVELRFGCTVTALHQNADGVVVDYVNHASDQKSTVRSKYLVGCDGPRSMVRKSLGIEYAGQSREQREFFGGQMCSIYFRSSDLYEVLDKPRAWMYWAVNREKRGLLVAIDGCTEFLLCVQLEPGQTPRDLDARDVARQVIGARCDFDAIAISSWVAGYTLVAERMQVDRVFIAGDAAHLFTPTGGLGYNTSIDDAVNLGWKLGAVLRGWAPPALLDTYEVERRPIALRNTGFARRMADSIGGVRIPAALNDDGHAGEAARRELAAALTAHVHAEFNIPGMQLGLRYVGSPIVAAESAAPPPDDPNVYVPSGVPGGRAPHVVIGRHSLLDHFGRDFTLLAFAPCDWEPWPRASTERDMPLSLLQIESPTARALYGADLILIRPDHHIAWRGTAASDAKAVLARACGSPAEVGAVHTPSSAPLAVEG